MDFLIHYGPWLLIGTLYGFLFGIIPVAGAATALLTIYGFISYFKGDPYSLVVFTTSIVVAASVGDLFASVVLNIPGGGGSAATMIDGYPMARRGEAARAMGASVFSAVAQGTFWGIIVILFLPYYAKIVLAFGIPELLSFLFVAIACICFLNSKLWVRSLIGLALGAFVGLIGTDPITTQQRFTSGWFYLADGIQFAPLMAGVMALPELLGMVLTRAEYLQSPNDNWKQIKQGWHDFWSNKWLSFRSGIIGGVVGLLPGIGGPMVEWVSYGQTVATNKNETVPFGEGNVKGVIGPEGANLAQKATAYVPTVLFGVPAAPFEVVVMSLLAYVGMDLGSRRLLTDHLFFDVLSFGFLAGMFLTFLISIWFIRYATLITRVPIKYWILPIIGLIVWSCTQYTGGWEDYAILILATAVGFMLKYLKISRISFIIGFALSLKMESMLLQFSSLYHIADLLHRPIALGLLIVSGLIIFYGIFFNRTTINYH
jgi:putative tricarboxylic transport membrane protein